jgi:beta-1,2-mannobiose phosphorylase / 1,2-beta-oligomannan phosphorylase
MTKNIIFLIVLLKFSITGCYGQIRNSREHQGMMFSDTTRIGIPFAKDPHVIRFGGRYLMYYSIPPYNDIKNIVKGWGIGIAVSKDLNTWEKTGEITPAGEYEKKGIAAPCALVIENKVHLFYQTYGNGRNDAICHAVSDDGINFIRDETNPVFHPTGDWNCGRAIDAEVYRFRDRYFLFFATRDPDFRIQIQGVAYAPLNTNFHRDQWIQITDYPILKPEYPWEGECIEGASVIQKGKFLFMFYAGAYNNWPQQIGVARSIDGIKWEKLSDKPFLTNGGPGEWNYSESGHPHIFKDVHGKTYLFYQGNNDKGKTWFISKVEVEWSNNGPILKK